jgi:NAD(P)H-hydrate repair Nnr-like enzyme with NAD(P)H-hydrate epimerase domain
MKTEIEKKIEELNQSKVPIVAIDPSLNKYQGKILFPKKLAIAEEKLKGIKLSEIKKHHS